MTTAAVLDDGLRRLSMVELALQVNFQVILPGGLGEVGGPKKIHKNDVAANIPPKISFIFLEWRMGLVSYAFFIVAGRFLTFSGTTYSAKNICR